MSQALTTAFFDHDTSTVSYIVTDPVTLECAVIDSVLDFDPAGGNTKTDSADKIIACIKANGWSVSWNLETHVHADHLSAAPYIQQQLGGKLAIGEHIIQVQQVFSAVFNSEAEFACDGSQFDHLFKHGEVFSIGQLSGQVLHTPGHTPACISYLIGDALFVGDTLFMPDFGTARCDFPGGDAKQLFQSIEALLKLPDSTRVFLCHDYLPPGRSDYRWETTIGEQKQHNIHLQNGCESFVTMRHQRDQQLAMPRLILPAVQVNMRAGHLPAEENNGIRYLKIPLNQF